MAIARLRLPICICCRIPKWPLVNPCASIRRRQDLRESRSSVQVGRYEIPRGSLIAVNTWALHRDPWLFEDPERFDPERFAPGWEAPIPRYAYLSFGGGPRVCLGNGFAMTKARPLIATPAQR